MALTSIGKDFITKGGIVIEGTGTVTTSSYVSSLSGALQVGGGAAIAANLIVGTTASIYGPTTLFGTLTANQPVTINSTLTVTGPTFLASTTATAFSATSIVVTGSEIIGGGLSVLGSTVLASTTVTSFSATSVVVAGNEIINGSFNVLGSAVLGIVTATAFTATSVTVNGNETITGGLSVAGASVFSIATATVFTATSLTVNGAAGISGVVTLSNNSNATNTASGALKVTGGVGIGQDLWVGGAAYIAGDLYVDGTQFVVNKQTIATGDATLTLSSGTTSAALAAGSGIQIGNTVTSAAYASFLYDGGTAPGYWYTANGLKVNSTLTNNGTAASGALQIAGGVGIGGGLTVTGTITATNHVGTIGSALSAIGGGTNLYGGTAGALVYQSAPSVTSFLNSGTNGQLLYMSGGQPTWVAPSGLSAGNATTASNIAGGLKDQIPYQSNPGQTTFGTGLTFNGTTFTATNAVVSGGTNASTTNSGALQVVGGVGIGQDLYVGGNINVNGSIFLKGVGLDTISGTTGTFVNVAVTGTGYPLTIANGGISIQTTATAASVAITGTNFNTSTAVSNALYVAGGVAIDKTLRVAGDSWLLGNLNVSGVITGTNVVINNLTGTNAQFYGDATGNGALYAGVLGYTPFAQTMFQATGNYNGYMEINVQNINTGTKASTDIVASADNVTISSGYIDMGITNSTWDGTQLYSLGTTLGPLDGYLMVGQNNAPGLGDLVFGTLTTGTQMRFVVAATLTQVTSASVAVVMNPVNTIAASTVTGTLIVYGGIAGTSAYIGGTVTSTNHILTGTSPAGASTNTGALQVAGGASIGAGLYIAGPTTSTGAIQMGSGATGLLLTNNGTNGAVYSTNVTAGATNYALASSGASTYVNGTTNVQFATNGVTTATIQGGLGSTSTYGGQTFIVAANGIGVTGNSYFANGVGFGGTVYANNLLSATSGVANTGTVNSGALQVVGGVGVTGGATFGGIVTATTFVGAFTGNLTGTASLATTASNLALGATGSIPIQVSPGVTGYIPLGTSGYVLTAGATTASWTALSGVTAGNATTATNIAGGAQYQIPFQSAAGVTTFSSNFTYNNTVNQFSATNIIVSGITTATGQLNASSGAITNGTGSGALVVTGGVGVSGSINVGGVVYAGVSSVATGVPIYTFQGGNTAFATYTSPVLTGSGQVTLDSWSTSSYRTARYVIQIVDSGKVHVTEMTVFTDWTNVYMNQYGISTNQGELGAFDANSTSTVGSVTLTFTPSPAASAMTIKVSRLGITA